MKLNLVADYEIGGKHIVNICAIHSSNNLAGLAEMTAANVPVVGGGWARVKAKTLQMCESKRKAQEVAHAWRRDYEAQGRRWDCITPFDASEITKAAEAESEAAK